MSGERPVRRRKRREEMRERSRESRGRRACYNTPRSEGMDVEPPDPRVQSVFAAMKQSVAFDNRNPKPKDYTNEDV